MAGDVSKKKVQAAPGQSQDLSIVSQPSACGSRRDLMVALRPEERNRHPAFRNNPPVQYDGPR